MIGDARMIAAGLLLAGAMPAGAQEYRRLSDEQLKPFLPAGETLEARADGDLTGDGVNDVAFVSRSEDKRTLTVLRAAKGEVQIEFPRLASRSLDPYPQGTAELGIAKGVLTMEEMTGGSTATNAIYRYRRDPATGRMRLIGLDATTYSRTFSHNGFEISWNLLTGALITRDMRVSAKGEMAYDPIVERRGRRVSPPVFLEDTPDPEDAMKAARGR